jgi:hypothetical protein
MKKYLIPILFFLPILTVYSQTEINQDYVKGQWIKANSPYIINNDITILAGDILEIESGVKILFQDNIKMTVLGSIYANGAFEDSITFSCVYKFINC